MVAQARPTNFTKVFQVLHLEGFVSVTSLIYSSYVLKC